LRLQEVKGIKRVIAAAAVVEALLLFLLLCLFGCLLSPPIPLWLVTGGSLIVLLLSDLTSEASSALSTTLTGLIAAQHC